MIFVADAQGSNAYTNLQFQTYTGLGEVKLPGIGWLDAIHPDDRERAAAVWAQSSRAGEPYAAEYRFRRADGAWRSFYCRGQPMRDPSKSIVQWVGTCTEIQQMVEARDELAALAVELEPLIRQATPGTSVSPSIWVRVLGYAEPLFPYSSPAIFSMPLDTEPYLALARMSSQSPLR